MAELDTERLRRLTPEQRAALLRRLQPPAAAAAGEPATSIPRRDRSQPAPLSFAQERLWFLEQLSPGLAAYNIALVVRLRGRLDRPALGRAFAAVVRRHEVLRTRFRDQGGRPFQEIESLPLRSAALPLVDLRGVAAGVRDGAAHPRGAADPGNVAAGLDGAGADLRDAVAGMGGADAGAGVRNAAVGSRGAAVGAAGSSTRGSSGGGRAEVAAQALAAAEAGRPFDLRAEPPLRSVLVRIADDEHLLLLTLHHIAGDVWSLGVLMRELGALYSGAALPALPVQYADYAVWQRQRLQGEVLEIQLAWWRERLAGLPALQLSEIAGSRAAPAVGGAPGQPGGRVPLELPGSLAAALRLLGREAATTLFMTLLAGYAVVLARYSGQDDFAVGTAVANRERRELEGLVGFFVNVLVLRCDLGGGPTFRQLLARVRALTLAAFGHQDLPFEKLVEELRPERDSRHVPLVQATLQVQNAPLPSLRLPGLALAGEPVFNQQAKFDLSLSLAETPEADGAIAGTVEYSAARFAPAAAERLAGHVRCVLAAAAAAPETPIAALSLLTAAERRQLLVDWNPGAEEWPPPLLAHRLFEAAVERAPASVALVSGDLHLSHGELDRRAGVLADALRRRGVGPESRVGLCLERGTELAIAVLAVLEAGGAWVPLDPGYPVERLALMIEDSAPRVVLALERHRRLAGAAPVLVLERGAAPAPGAAAADSAAVPAASPALRVVPDNAAYVIYTSGSTGRPKGVVVTHRGLHNLVEGEARFRGLRQPRRVVQFSSPSFDASVTEFFQAAAWGGTLVYGTRDQLLVPRELAALLCRHAVDTATLPPAMVALLDPLAVPGLAALMVAGEPCAPEVMARWSVGRRLWNAYGPTECTVCATTHECGDLAAAVAAVGGGAAAAAGAAAVPPPIGRPLPNLRAYVAAGEMAPSPVGLAGELYLGGEGLARGYLGQPGLTAERFVPDPFGGGGGRLYRTGDRARWRGDGELEFLGRADQQIKLRGFRIEPGEIEAALRREAGVREAVVVVRELAPGDRRLVAYVEAPPAAPPAAIEPPAGPEPSAATEPLPGSRLRGRELRDGLARSLPEHMLPAAVVVLERLPRLPNGKLDRRALPAPAPGGAGGGGVGESAAAGPLAPPDPLAEIFAGVWSEVLGVERVGVEDDFFADLGGHSLLATQVISLLRERAGIELPVRALFEAPTVGRLAAWAAAAGAPAGGEAVPELARRGGSAVEAPLSFAQERLWFLDQLAPGLAVYNVPLAVCLRGRLDRRALARALHGLTRRHEVLRTRFGEAGGRPVQRIAAAADVVVPLPVVDLRGLDAAPAATAPDAAPPLDAATARAGAEAARLTAAEAARPFDLRLGPLLRARLVRLADEEHLLLLTLHHIVSDGWSLGVVVRELAALYAGAPLPELAVQFADYALWQRRWLQGDALERQLEYWRQQLAGLPALQLPVDGVRAAPPSHRGGRVRLVLPADLAAALRRLGRAAGATLFMTLLAGFQALLARYSGQDDVAVGTVVANRRRRELEGLVGFFANTLVLRTDLAGGPSLAELLARVRAATLAAYDHQDLPFERLVEELRPARDASLAPLVQVFFVLQNAPLPAVRLAGLELAALPVDSGTAKFDLSVVMTEEDDGAIAATLEHSAELFAPATVSRLGDHLRRLLDAAAADPEERWDRLPLLAPAERRQVVEEWNRTARDWGAPRPVHELFERQAEVSPAAAAAVCGELVLTYGELNRRANRLAHELRALGVGPEARVGLLLERGPELILSALAVMKAGGAYVPLDPAYPRERLAFMIEDAAPRVVVAAANLAALAAPAPVLTIPTAGGNSGRLGNPGDLDGSGNLGNPDGLGSPGSLGAAGAGRAWPAANPRPLAGPANAAYVIFTSGSTGRPKGAVVEHRNLWHLLHGIAHAWDLRQPRRVLQFSSPSFDASVGEIFAALPWGGTLVHGGRGRVLPTRELVDLVRQQAVDLAILPPSILAVLDPAEWPGLATLVAAGEACPAAVAARWAPGRQLWNGYGPTECTVFATTWACDGGAAPPAIGRPLANLRTYVLDAALAPCPVGVPGELYIGGPGVSRGYLQRPELTAERFVPDPFGAAGERLYRTGDRTLWRPDGALAYRGRLDQQVKLRGFRIELGEIEAVLRQLPAVREAVAVLRDDAPGGPRLVGYVAVADADSDPRLAGELRRHCQRLLPDHMVPAAFVALAALPLTANGKLDRRALPAPAAPDTARAGGFVPPRTPLEEILAGIWAGVLGVERVGVEDDFFADLGGHSLLATQVVARVREVLAVELPLRSLFEAPTVGGWAATAAAVLAATGSAAATAAGGPAASPPRRRPAGGETPLSFAQERLWFLEQLTPGLAVYNVPLAVRLTGRLEPPRLAAALAALVRRHEVLRTRFAATGGRPAQVIAAPEDAAAAVALPTVDLRRGGVAGRRAGAGGRAARGPGVGGAAAARLPGAESAEMASPVSVPPPGAEAARLASAEAARPFDLGRELPLRACLLVLGDSEHLLLLTLHHIASDGWSLGVLVAEVAALYAGEALPPLPIQYADYAIWQRQWLRGARLESQLGYWRRQLAGLTALELPADRPRSSVRRHRGGWVRVALPASSAAALARLGRDAGVTPFMTLLAGFQALLGRYGGELDVAVGTAVANRRHRELEGLIGFFVNTLVLRTDVGAASFGELLTRVRAVTLDGYGHQDVPFEKLVEELRPARDTGQNPLVQVMLILQNAPQPALRLPGLVLAAEPIEGRTAKLDLSLSLAEGPAGIAGVLEYDAELYDPATAERLAGHFLRLLTAAVAAPAAPLAELPLLAAGERRQVVEEWNETAREPREPGAAPALDARVAAQARRTPDSVAVVHGGRRLTYGELDRAAGRLAGRLCRLGVGGGDLVAVSLERSADMVVALLGVLAAGAAYVPVDPDYPAERRAFVLADARIACGVTSTRTLARLGGEESAATRWICVDGPQAAREDGGIPEPRASSEEGELAYVIYTSGSTGRPKGVAISHRSAVAFVDWCAATFPRGAFAGVLAGTSISFDLSVFELFATLSCGGTVVVAENLFDDAAWEGDWPITLVNTVPSLLDQRLAERGLPASVEIVNLAGEALSGSLVERLRAALPGAVVMNLYGPSESTTYATWARIGHEATPPIGRPVAGTRAYVLDGVGAPQPVGVPGELYLGGAGLARGYAHRPELTAERFVPDGFAGGGGRLYRTGDRVRWRPGGALEYLGRLDDQVKLRGFRIEPGEIAAALRDHPAVREAAVVLRADAAAGPRLVAYVVPATDGAPDAELAAALYRRCRERLPAHLLPAAFVVLARLPLTPNGKLDRRALPAPEAGGLDGAGAFVAPATPFEEIVAGLWAEVLGRERVGVEDDFFADLGGHSLLATQAVARLRDRLGVELPLRSLFEAPTARAWAARVAAVSPAADPAGGAAADRIPRRPEAVPGAPAAALPLSFAQERLWFLEQLTPGLAVYNLPLAVSLRGRLDRAALARALAAVVGRHEALRSRFRFAAGQPVQEVAAAAAVRVRLPVVDLRALRGLPVRTPAAAGEPSRLTAGEPSRQAAGEASRLAAGEAARPFDLRQGPLLRGVLLWLAPDEHLLLLTLHHIASDGWSLGVLFGELGALYAGEALPELPLQYPDYAVWQRRWLRGDALAAQLGYWRQQLAGLPVLQLPLDRPRPAVLAHRGAQRRGELPAELVAALRRLAGGSGATLFMTLLAGFQALLARHAGQEDFAVGTAVANRARRELEGLIGFFVNTLALRTSLAGEPTVRQLLARVREVTLGAYGRQEVPFERLVEELRPPRDTGQNPLVQVMLVLQNTPAAERRLPALELRGVPVASQTAKFDLLVSASEHAGGITATWEYDASLFDAATIDRLAGHWRRWLAAAAAAPQAEVAAIAALPLLGAAERHQLLVDWSGGAVDGALPPPVHRWFEAQAARTPEAAAVVAGDPGGAGFVTLTYAELNRQANRLAHHLRALGVGTDERVGLALPRGPAQIAAVVAVLKAGGAYVPLDLAYPPARLAAMLADAAPRVVLTTAADRAVAGAVPVCCLDLEAARLAALPAGDLAAAAAAESAAYVIFTSGSTGRPKGVVMPHAAAANLIAWQLRETPAAARILQMAPASFDASFHEIFTALCAGGTLVLIDEGLRRDPPALWRRIGEQEVERLFLPFTLLQSLAQARPPLAAGSALGALIVSGERLQLTAEIAALGRELPGCVLYNEYGPTETHVCTSLKLAADPGAWETWPSIGRPIDGARVHLLDAQLQPVPIGVAGELCAGGVAVARGYLDRPRATAERFVPDAFGAEGGRLYRTGDRARFRPDGELEYLGRLDQQVKLRGFRIEPGEVEAVLARAAAVREAAVVLREDAPGDARLVAYVVAAGEGRDAGELRRHCQSYLPGHMVPASFAWLERLPLTPSGKLDRRALAALPAGAAGPAAVAAADFVAPRGEVERTVAAAWQEVLQVERVGVADNFFDLGGHSLLVLRLHALLAERLGRELAVVDLFRHPTVESFARFVAEPAAAPAAPGGAEGDKGRQLAAGRGRLESQLAARQAAAAARRRPT